MRILHIASGDLWAGAEVQISTLLSQLVQKRYQVNAILLNSGKLADVLAEQGVNVTVFSENAHNFFELLLNIRRHVNSLNPDVIHTHRQKEHILGCVANTLGPRVPCVRTVHGSPEFSPRLSQKVQVALDRFCGRHLQQGIVSVSSDLTKKLMNYFPASKIHTIPNGIDAAQVKEEATTLSAGLRVASDKLHVGLVGRMEGVKRVDLFLQMAKLLKDDQIEGKSLQFHVFGSGRLFDSLNQWAADNQIQQQVTFYGHRNDIRGWIKKMDVLVMPSDHEGLPMTALESFAVGTPLVAHAVGGLVPLLEVAYPQGLVHKHTAQGYAVAVREALTHRKNIDFPADYDASRNADRVIELYNALQ